MRATRGLAEAALISAAVIALQWMGRGTLAAPPLTSWSEVLRWADQRDAVTIAMVLVRLLTLALGYHVLVTTALVVLGRVLHKPRIADWAEAVTLPPFRGTAQRLVGLSMSISTLVAGPGASAGAAVARPATERVVIERIDQVSSADTSSGGGTATLQVTPPPSTVTPHRHQSTRRQLSQPAPSTSSSPAITSGRSARQRSPGPWDELRPIPRSIPTGAG